MIQALPDHYEILTRFMTIGLVGVRNYEKNAIENDLNTGKNPGIPVPVELGYD